MPDTQNKLLKIKKVALLGSTGSIGTQTIEVLQNQVGFEVVALSAGSNCDLLSEQANLLNVKNVALANFDDKDRSKFASEVKIFTGENALCDLLEETKPDIVVTALMGSAGLLPTLKAIELGADIALANKETLVCAGELVIPTAKKAGVNILPVDSEHSGIFQCYKSGKTSEIRKVTITSSGGALRNRSDEDAYNASARDALNHPTWEMGKKITIDSATLMNKVLEVIEAHWLFDLDQSQIEVVIHPQSIVHALVEFCDGSVLAQLAEPDMKLPIAYALYHPDRPNRKEQTPELNLVKIANLEFKPVEGRNTRAINLAWRVIKQGKCAGAILNAANEIAVKAFLNDQIKFGNIIEIVEQTLDLADLPENQQILGTDSTKNSLQLENIIFADNWARKQAVQIIQNYK